MRLHNSKHFDPRVQSELSVHRLLGYWCDSAVLEPAIIAPASRRETSITIDPIENPFLTLMFTLLLHLLFLLTSICINLNRFILLMCFIYLYLLMFME